MRAVFVIASLGALVLGSAPASARRHPAPSPTPLAVPVPAAAPTALSETARIERMGAELEAVAKSAPGKLGIAVVDLSGNVRYSVRGGESFPLASVYKIAIGVAAYRRADQKRLDLDEHVIVSRGDLRRGASEIATAHPKGGASYTYWQLVRAMLVTSDDTASDVVLRAVGGPRGVHDLLERLNVRGLTIRKSEAELATDARRHLTYASGGDNGGTPDGVAALLAGLAMGRYTLLDSTDELLLHLGDATTGMSRLRAGIPPGARFAHKTGTSDTFDGTTDATNDAGILTLPDGRRIAIVAFLGQSHADAATRDATLARVGRAVAGAYEP